MSRLLESLDNGMLSNSDSTSLMEVANTGSDSYIRGCVGGGGRETERESERERERERERWVGWGERDRIKEMRMVKVVKSLMLISIMLQYITQAHQLIDSGLVQL